MHRISRFGVFVIVLVAVVALVGCSDDDGTNPTPQKHPIVGSWEQVFDDPDYYYKITFHENGTGSEISMYQGVMGSENDFTYEVIKGKTNGTVIVDMGGGEVYSAYFLIDEYDWLTIDYGEETAQFNRVTEPDPDPDPDGIEGTWTLTATVVESTCGGFPGAAETFCVTITRDGDIVTLVVGNETIIGTMITNSTAQFDLSGNGCTVDLILTVNPEGTMLTGSNPVECPATDISEGCSENSTITATRKTGGC